MEFLVLRCLLPFLISSSLMSGCVMTGGDSGHVEFNVELSKLMIVSERVTSMEI